MAELKKEADKKREEELARIRMIVAAKSIQKAWRAYKTRILLKNKKKRKKKSTIRK